jgi:hypothetical protein
MNLFQNARTRYILIYLKQLAWYPRVFDHLNEFAHPNAIALRQQREKSEGTAQSFVGLALVRMGNAIEARNSIANWVSPDLFVRAPDIVAGFEFRNATLALGQPVLASRVGVKSLRVDRE